MTLRNTRRGMTESRALRLAIQVIQREIQRLAPNANLHDQYHLCSPEAINASKQHKMLQEALGTLKQIMEPKTPTTKVYERRLIDEP